MLISLRLTQPVAATWGGRLGAVVLSLSAIDEIKRLPHQLSSREWEEWPPSYIGWAFRRQYRHNRQFGDNRQARSLADLGLGFCPR